MTKINAEWVNNPNSRAVCRMLTGAGFDCYFVGGCVRNALLNEAVNDIDISTDARPKVVMQLAEGAGLKAIPTGIEHGTVTVVSGGVPYEITTYRRDVETDGRRAVVAFADTIGEDALRRDFTMNALYADADGHVIDPLNGLPDLRARRIRFIEDADKRIKEDYLRILRFFRFHAWYGDEKEGLDAEGLAACAANLQGLETLSKERIGAEMLKLLSAPDPAPSVAAMQASGVLGAVLPGATAKALSVLVHLEQQANVAPEAIRRLAVLGGENIQERLRLKNSDAKRLHELRSEIGSIRPPAELGYRLGREQALDVVLLRNAVLETPFSPDVIKQIEKGARADFPVRPADLMPKLQGPALGRKLRELEKRWIESDFSLSKEQLLA